MEKTTKTLITEPRMSTNYTSLDHRVIDAAIASRVCGWTRRKARTGGVFFFSPESWADCDAHDKNDPQSWTPCDVGDEDNAPYYSTDYNAVHEALGKLTEHQFISVANRLMIGKGQYVLPTHELLRSTPRQICEAILEALDKEAAR